MNTWLSDSARPTSTTGTGCMNCCRFHPVYFHLVTTRIGFALFAGVALLAAADDLASRVAQQAPSLVAIYKNLHAHPELSMHEEQTGALLAAELRKVGYTVTA